MDPDGCIKLVDRSKDLVKSGGEWISSVDLENTLMSHPAVREAGVVAVQHPKWQERPLAVVALKDGAQVTADELRDILEREVCQVADAGRFCFCQRPAAYVDGKIAEDGAAETVCGVEVEGVEVGPRIAGIEKRIDREIAE